jgi:hypothetical protein
MEIFRKYGEAATILFPLIDAGAQDFEATPVTFASGDAQIMKDEGAFVNATNNPTHEGGGVYSLALTAAEMQAARVVVTIKDSPTKAWEDQAIIISTYGNASAQHAFDLDAATVTVGANNDKSGYGLAADQSGVTIGAVGTVGTVAALGAQARADVKGEVAAEFDAAGSELSAMPTTSGTLRQKINFLFQYFRNKKTVTSTAETLLKEDASTTLGSATISDDGVTFTKGEMN